MRIEEVRDFQRFLEVRESWDELLHESEGGDAFLSWEWLTTWWRHKSASHGLRLLLAWDGPTLLGAVPLMRLRSGGRARLARVHRSIGIPPPDVSGFLVRAPEQEVLSALGEHLAARGAKWDVLELREISRSHVHTPWFLEAFPSSQWVVSAEESHHFLIPLAPDWDTYLKGLSKNLRTDLRKKRNRLGRQGELSFRRYSGADVRPEMMEDVYRINALARYPRQYASDVDRAYHTDLATQMAKRGWLDLSFVHLNGTPVAFRYGFVFNGVYEDWRTGFDLGLFEFSVGKLLLLFVLEDCFRQGLRGFHFMFGEDEYKGRWQVERIPFETLRIVRRHSRGVATDVWWPKTKGDIRSWMGSHAVTARAMHRYDAWRGNE